MTRGYELTDYVLDRSLGSVAGSARWVLTVDVLLGSRRRVGFHLHR